MDQGAISLFPTNQVGADGTGWWVGQIEEIDNAKNSNRFKVRIISVHSDNCSEVPKKDLPWAKAALPVTVPYKEGGSSGATANLTEGDWVFGVWLDNQKTKPLILASIGTTANASNTPPEAQTNADFDNEDKCLAFKTKLKAETNPYSDLAQDAKTVNKNASSGQIAGSNASTGSPQDKAHAAENSKANPLGTKVCVATAQAECNSDMKKGLAYVLGELFKMVQDSGGNLGDAIISRVNGEVFSYIKHANEYITKAQAVLRDGLARIRGEIIKKLKEGVEWLVKLILSPFEGVLESVQEWLKTTLEKIGCSIEDIYERLVDFMTGLIFDMLLKVFRAATCQVDIFVNAILQKINSFISQLVNSVLGPLQSILGSILSPINLVGSVLFKVMSILGISCGGINSQCSDEDKKCNKKEQKPDFLDNLLDDIRDGPLDYGQSVCDDARSSAPLDYTGGVIFGGLQSGNTKPPRNDNIDVPGGGSAGTIPPNDGDDIEPEERVMLYSVEDVSTLEGDEAVLTIRRSGYTEISSSITYKCEDETATSNVDYIPVTGVLGFGKNQLTRELRIQTIADAINEEPETFLVRFDYSSGAVTTDFETKVAQVTIGVLPETDFNPIPEIAPPIYPGPVTPEPVDPPVGGTEDEELPDGFPDNDTPPETFDKAVVDYFVTTDKTDYKEGEFITYTIYTTNVPNDTSFGYTLFGADISAADIVGGELYGTFTVTNNKATVVVGIAEDSTVESRESLTFSVNGTGAVASVTILPDVEVAITDPREIAKDTEFEEPELGDPIVGDDGRIIEIPVKRPGSSYLIAPNIAITGQGWGALGVPILDPFGKVVEIRITQRGRGYIPNYPEQVNCVLSNITLTRPGSGYTTPPTVYVNGVSGIVSARINASGNVIGFDVADRTRVYKNAPKVEIVGDGLGAKALASMSCLDNDTRDLLGYTKIGAGRYIDCPS